MYNLYNIFLSLYSSLTALYKKSDEYKKLRSVLDPMLDTSFLVNKGKTPINTTVTFYGR